MYQIDHFLANAYSQIGIIVILVLIAWIVHKPIFKIISVFLTYWGKQAQLAKINHQISEELSQAQAQNAEWESILNDIDRRHTAIRAELEISRKDVEKLKSLRKEDVDRVHNLEVDLTAMQIWGRQLVGQLAAYKLTPTFPEPELLTKSLPRAEIITKQIEGGK